MRTLTITEFEAHAAEALQSVERGEMIVVTRRGKPVADLVPHAREKSRFTPTQLAEGRRQLDILKRADKTDDWADYLAW
jgi:prevent-host-death family protein